MPGEVKMSDAEMDHILSRRDEILPSSGFAASVMEAVRREALVPPPIPFPWKRALPVLALAAAVLVLLAIAGVVAILELGKEPSGHLTIPSVTASMPASQGTIASAVGWTALALLTAFVSVKLSMRLAAGRT